MLPPARLTSGRDRYAAEARGPVYPLEIVSAGFDQALAERAVREEVPFSYFHPALQLVVREFSFNTFHIPERLFRRRG